MAAHAPGTFCWCELGTSAAAAAKKFYTSLFGWKGVDTPSGPDSVYTMLHLGKKTVGGLYQLDERQRGQGVPPHWLTYVAVASANQAAKKAKALGGTVLAEPFDVMNYGRMAPIQDPQGAHFAVWQARKHKGAQVVGKPGSMCWNELATKDTKAAAAFYTKLFAWKAKPSSAGEWYTEFWKGRRSHAGMMALTPEMGDTPPHWLIYFAVADCKRTAAKAEKLGAKLLVPPRPIPKVGTFSVIQDPQGAVFAVIKLKARM
jgi:predicted enzyme related to lactoylglutathione lyase